MMDYENHIKIITLQDLLKAECFNVKASLQIIENALTKQNTKDLIFPNKVSVVFDESTQNRINCLPAGIRSQEVYGMKWVSVFPVNPHKYNIPNLSAVIVLSSLKDGFPKAFMEGSLCSNLRTAAVGSVAAKYLARKNAETIGFIGAGEQAKSHFLGMMAVRPSIKKCFVSSRTNESCEKFIVQMKRFYPEVEFIGCGNDYRKSVVDADIIVTAISGQDTILKADWIKSGAFYCHVAGLEDEDAVALKASKIVCDDWNVVKHRTQTISRMYKAGVLNDSDIYANLKDIIVGNKPGRENEEEFIYFNSVGLSFLDVALANWMFQKVEEKGLGTDCVLQDMSMFDVDEKYFVK